MEDKVIDFDYIYEATQELIKYVTPGKDMEACKHCPYKWACDQTFFDLDCAAYEKELEVNL